MAHSVVTIDTGLIGFSQFIGPVGGEGLERDPRGHQLFVTLTAAGFIGLMGVWFFVFPVFEPVLQGGLTTGDMGYIVVYAKLGLGHQVGKKAVVGEVAVYTLGLYDPLIIRTVSSGGPSFLEYLHLMTGRAKLYRTGGFDLDSSNKREDQGGNKANDQTFYQGPSATIVTHTVLRLRDSFFEE